MKKVAATSVTISDEPLCDDIDESPERAPGVLPARLAMLAILAAIARLLRLW